MYGKKTSWQMYVIIRKSSNKKIIREQLGVFKTVERMKKGKIFKKKLNHIKKEKQSFLHSLIAHDIYYH